MEENETELLNDTTDFIDKTVIAEEKANLETTEDLPVIEKVIVEDVAKSEKKKKNTKTFLIILLVIFIVAVLGVFTSIFVPKLIDKHNNSSSMVQPRVVIRDIYEAGIRNAIENGSFDKELKKALDSNSIQTTKVEIISFDIDSDEDVELLVYAEDETKKFLLQFEVDDTVVYEDSYQIDSKDSIGYVYSYLQENTCWYTLYANKYTIINDTKYIIQEDIFANDYYIVTKTLNETNVLSQTIPYEIGKKSNVDRLFNTKITKEIVLNDQNISFEEIKNRATDLKRSIEAEQAQKKAEELVANNSFQLNGRRLVYGTYKDTEDPIEVSTIVIEKNGTAIIDGSACTWNRAEHEFSAGGVTAAAESIIFLCSNTTYYYTAMNDFELTNAANSVLKYQEE